MAFLRSGGSGTGSVIRGDQAKNAFSRSSSTLKKFPVPSSLYSETRVDSMRCLLLSMGWGQKSASARLIEDTNRRCQKLQTGCWNFFPQRKKAAVPAVDAAACSVSSGKMAQRFTLKAAMPGYTALPPSCSSMRSSWLYLATRSVRLGAPVLIWQVFKATARSAMVVSSVSPER